MPVPPKILSVDDDPTIRKCITLSFQSFNCEVLEAADGLEGLAIARREEPDLILLDSLMPVMDGAEMLASLKKDPALREIPVMMLTVEATRERVIQLLRQGVTDYVLKPFRMDQLLVRVGKIIDLTAGTGTHQEARRLDHPVRLVVVDDKPAIVQQIRQALAGTPWNIRHVAQPGQALDQCLETLPDLILISLSLPGRAGFTLFQMLRGRLLTRTIPILGLSVVSAIEEQKSAEQLGFDGIVTKPLAAAGLREKIASTLRLDSSSQHFRATACGLVLTIPASLAGSALNEIAARVPGKLIEGVDEGAKCFILDLSQVPTMNPELIKLGHDVIQLCQENHTPFSLIGSKALCRECEGLEETKDWQFVRSMQEALTHLHELSPCPA